VTTPTVAGLDLSAEEWDVIAGVLWEHTPTRRRTRERRDRVLALRQRIVDTYRDEWRAIARGRGAEQERREAAV